MNDIPSEHPVGWDALFQAGVFPPRYKTNSPPNESVVAWADTLPPSSTVLDVGCGVGRHVVYLGGRGFAMSGSDVSPNGVRTTQQVCAERHIPFDGRVADMTALPWEDNTFDALLSTSTICHHRIDNILKTLAEMWRVLKPGGLLLVDFLHKATQSYQNVRQQVADGTLSEIEPNTFIDDRPNPDMLDDAFLPHHYTDESDVWALSQQFERINLYADLAPAPEGELPKRGYWVAWARKPMTD